MKMLCRNLLTGGLAALLCLSVHSALAQNDSQGGNNKDGNRERERDHNRDHGRGGQDGGPGRWDPAQFQQRMLERVKEQLEVKDDAEWKAIQPLVQKVMDARMATMSGLGRGLLGRGGPRPGGESGPGGGGFRGFGPSAPELDALQKAIDAKASSAELKTAIAKAAEARKAKQAELDKAQADLRKVLTVRQEAIATASGLL